MEGNPGRTGATHGDKGASTKGDNRSTAERVGGVPDKAAGSPQRSDTRTGGNSAPKGATSTDATSGRTAGTTMEGNPGPTGATHEDKGASTKGDNRSNAERVGGVPDKAAGSPQRSDTRTGSTSDTTKP
jgi:hypothetical protein